MSKEIELKENLSAKEQVDLLLKSKMLPDTLRTASDAFIALQACNALGAKSFKECLGYISKMAVVKGNLYLWGELPLTIVINSGELEDIKEFFVDKDYKEISLENKNLNALPEACIVEITRKGQKMRRFFVSKTDLEISGVKIDDKGKGEGFTWSKYPKAMWIYRARRIALRAVFPDKLQNFSVASTEKEFQDKEDRPPQAPKLQKVERVEEPSKVEQIKEVFEGKKEEAKPETPTAVVDEIIKKVEARRRYRQKIKRQKRKLLLR